jgi:hypothetical protein
MIRVMLTAVALAVSGAALAKIPAPTLDEAAKAKAAEAAAKTAWQAKADSYQLCKAQDRVAANYKKTVASRPAASGAVAKPMPAAPTAAAAALTTPTAPNGASASQGGSTPAAAVAPVVAIPGCADPGPFAYAPPEQKPLEASGAHSPAATATSPPSVRSNSAEMAPSKPGVAPKK